MQTEKLTESMEKMLKGYAAAATEFGPELAHAFKKIETKSQHLQQSKSEIEQDIERGARSTKHRIRL